MRKIMHMMVVGLVISLYCLAKQLVVAEKKVDPVFALIKSAPLGDKKADEIVGKKVVEYLRAHPESLKSVNEWGETVLHAVLECSLNEPALYLVEQGHGVNKDPGYGGDLPLNRAIYMRDPRLLEAMLKRGAQVRPEGSRRNPLLVASQAMDRWFNWSEADRITNLKIVQMLIDAGADLNKDNPLGCALGEHNFKVAELLLERGADVNQPAPVTYFYKGHAFEYSDEDVTPLVYGFLTTIHKDAPDFKQSVAMLKKLIAKGAPVTQDMLSIPGVNYDLEMKEILRNAANKEALKAGKPAKIESDEFFHAILTNDIPTVEFIIKTDHAWVNRFFDKGGVKLAPIVLALTGGKDQIAQILLKNGADITARTTFTPVDEKEFERSPEDALYADASLLHLAALSFLPELVEILIQKGVKPSANKYGMTPLHALAMYLPGGPGNVARQHLSDRDIAERGAKIIAALIKNGVDINAQDAWGKTALHRAAVWSPELMLALFAAGADPCLVDNENKTALSLAREYQTSDQRWQKAIKKL